MTKINTYTKTSLIAITILSFTVSNTMATVTPDMVDINLHPGETFALTKTVELTGLLPIDNDLDGAFDEDTVDLVNNDLDCLDTTPELSIDGFDDDGDLLVDETTPIQKGGSSFGICILGDFDLVDEDPGDYTVDFVIDDGCDDASDPFFKTITPISYTMAAGGSTVEFSETITVPGTTVPGEYHCDDPQGVEFFADDNTTPLTDENTSLGTEDEWIDVIATLGFYKHHPDVTAAVIDAADEDGDGTDCGTAVAAAEPTEIAESCKTLGDFVVEDGATAVAILEEASAGKDARKMEAAQLLTAKLNVNSGVDVSGPSCTAVATAISTADTHLSDAPAGLDYDGPGSDGDGTVPTKNSTPYTKADVTATSGILDSFNNIGC